VEEEEVKKPVNDRRGRRGETTMNKDIAVGCTHFPET
jgi:hypothetical protein